MDLEEIGKGDSTTFVLPQELTSLVGRYGKHLQGADAKENGHVLEGLEFDQETRQILGLDAIEELLDDFGERMEVRDVDEAYEATRSRWEDTRMESL